MRPSGLFSLLGAIVLVAGCGGGGGGATPTSPTSTATSASSATRIIAIEGSLEFGNVVVGDSKELTLTIRNTGTGVMSVTGLTTTASAAVTSMLAGTFGSRTVLPNSSTTLTVRFTPSATGAVSGTIAITADNTSGTSTVAFSGAGVGAPVTVTGVVTDANTGRPIGGVEVVALTAAVARAGATTTDGNGFYSFVLPSATPLSVGYRKDSYNYQSSTVTFTGDTRRDIRLNPFWTRSGTGANVFDMPTYVSRVKITGVLTGGLENFIVKIGGRLVVNEIIGNRSGYQQRFEGTYATSGGVVEVTYSTGVAWTFEQVQ